MNDLERSSSASFSISLAALLGIAHAAVDGSAGWMCGVLTQTLAPAEVGGLLVLYNVLAFAAQPAFGSFVDRTRCARLAVWLGMLAQVLALVLLPIHPGLAVAVAGLGSAIFHVGAGAISLLATPGRAAGIGLFAAPGVLGLAVGAALAMSGIPVRAVLIALLGGLGALLIMSKRARADETSAVTTAPARPLHESLRWHDLLIVCLFAAIALRSLVWTALNWVLQGEAGPLVLMAACAAAGKVAGGFLADLFGWRQCAVLGLGASAFLAACDGSNTIVLCLSAGCLQSATPPTVMGVFERLPARPGLTVGLSFGLVIALAGVPFAMGIGEELLDSWVRVLMLVGAAMLSWLCLTPRLLTATREWAKPPITKGSGFINRIRNVCRFSSPDSPARWRQS